MSLLWLLFAALVAAQTNTTMPATNGTVTTTSTASLPPANMTSTTAGNNTETSAPPAPIDVTKLPVLAWIIAAGVFALVVFFNVMLVRYYTHRHESELFPFIVTVAALTVTMFAVFLVPLDVYLADAAPANGDVVRYAYYALYISVMVFVFILIPFAYFYYEEDDEDVTFKQRVIGGCKYTSFLIVILIVLIVIGALIKSKRPDINFNVKDPMNVDVWLQALFTKAPGDFVVTFGLSCLTVVGFLVLLTYTSYGLAALPIDMMRGHKSLEEEEASVYTDLNLTKEKKRNINAKYISGKQMSKDDKRKLAMLARQERLLSREGERIEEQQSGCNRVLAALRPFAFIFGALLFLFSLFLFISVAMTQVVKIAGTPLCGAACGYIVDTPALNNPLDFVLQRVARAQAFIDVVLFAVVIIYLFFVTLAGIVKMGIRILWISLFQLKKRASPPQGLLLASVLLVLGMLAINSLLMALAPQYTTYGGQTYDAGGMEGIKPCQLSAPPGVCHMSQIAILVTTMNLNLSFFGVIFYWAAWAFLATTLLATIFAIVRCRRSNVERSESDSDEPE